MYNCIVHGTNNCRAVYWCLEYGEVEFPFAKLSNRIWGTDKYIIGMQNMAHTVKFGDLFRQISI